MHRLAVLLVLAAACGGNQNVGPVAGSHEAFERHYPVTVVEAHAALIKVLTERYGDIMTDDGLHVVAQPACRDKDGAPCASYGGDSGAVPGAVGGPLEANRNSHGSGNGTTIVGHYWFQVYAGVVGTDGDVQLQLGGHAKDHTNHEYAIGAPGAPAWMPHEVDEIRVAVDHALAAK